MVTVIIIIAVLVAVWLWVRMEFRIRYYRKLAELNKELYEAERDCFEAEQSWRMALEVNLQQSREMVSRMIGENARVWAENEAKKATVH